MDSLIQVKVVCGKAEENSWRFVRLLEAGSVSVWHASSQTLRSEPNMMTLGA